MKTPLRHLSLCTYLFIASISLMFVKDAHAERPWVTTSTQAHFLRDQKIQGQIEPILTALPDGTLFTLDLKGIPQRIDPETGILYPLTGLPPLKAINATNQGLWGVSIKPKKILINFSAKGQLLNHISLESLLFPQSHITAILVSSHAAFLADEGVPALIVINLDTGKGERLLDASPSLIAHSPFYRNGKMMKTPENLPKSGGNIRFMVLSSKGDWLFYQAPSGPLYRLGTTILTDPEMSPAQQIEAMAEWRKTPSLGGLSIWNDDSLYMVDSDHGDLLKFGADRLPWRLLHDLRLTKVTDMALLPKTSLFPLNIAVLTKDPSQEMAETHLLTYGIPTSLLKSSP